MTRRAFTMRLKPNASAEYRYHHDHIWPELVAEIERSGIAAITTFQRDDELFLVSEIADEEAWDRLWNSPVHQRWVRAEQGLHQRRQFDNTVDRIGHAAPRAKRHTLGGDPRCLEQSRLA